MGDDRRHAVRQCSTFELDRLAWVERRLPVIGVLASALIAALVVHVWRTQRHRPLLVRDATIAGVLLAFATAVGVLMPSPDNGIIMPALSMAAAAALWVVLVAVAMRASRGLPSTD